MVEQNMRFMSPAFRLPPHSTSTVRIAIDRTGA
jgi:hypothetical protein